MPHLSKILKKQRLSFQTFRYNLQRPTKIRNHAKDNYKIFIRPWVIRRKCNLWSKFASLAQTFNTIKTVLLNFAFSLAKAKQNMKSCKKYFENTEQDFTQIYPKLQHNKDCFTKIWIFTCKYLLKYGIMSKIAKKIMSAP